MTRSAAEPDYGSHEYWDERYREDGADYYDWLGEYERFRGHIEKATTGRRDAAILDLGCGNARLLDNLYDDGYTNLTGFDLSAVVIESMRERSADIRPAIKWVRGDVLQGTDFPDESFDLVVDKSTMDAISCDGGKSNQNLVRMTAEVSRVLKQGGVYLVFIANNQVAENALRLPHVLFDIERTDIPVPFTTLSVFAATKQVGAGLRAVLRTAPTLAEAEAMDASLAVMRRERAAAEERLKNQAKPATFGLLD